VGARLEKVWQWWRRVKPYIWRGLLWGLVGLVVAGAIWALIYVPRMQVPVCPPGKEGLPTKICFDIENEARKTLAHIMGGVLAIIGITLAFRRIRALERQVQVGQDQLQVGQEQLQVAKEGQITERFTRAIEQLGSQERAIRLGGIYALERIANDSDKDYWPIRETLTAYVRERAPWQGQSQDANMEEFPEEQEVAEGPSPWQEPKIKPATDIQAVLTALGRRKYRYGQGETKRLDLRNTDLRGIDLRGVHLEGVILQGAHLEGSYLVGAHLVGAFLDNAHLKVANLLGALLQGSYLSGVHLESAGLWGTHLQGAQLIGTHFKGAHLDRSHVEGANLVGVKGLTREQLAVAFLDENTKLPEYLQEQARENKGKGERG